MSKDPVETSTSILGADLIVEGNLTSRGAIQVDGTVKGDIRGKAITVSAGATVEGSLRADTVSVWGSVSGQVNGRHIKLMKNGEVSGDLCYQSLSIEEGASFEGRCRRSDDPVAEDARPTSRETEAKTFRPRTEPSREVSREARPPRPREVEPTREPRSSSPSNGVGAVTAAAAPTADTRPTR